MYTLASSVLQAVRALRNAPAALAVFLAGVAPVIMSPDQVDQKATSLRSDVSAEVPHLMLAQLEWQRDSPGKWGICTKHYYIS